MKDLRMPLTYEQLAPSLYKWGRILSVKFPRFQAHELINAVWLKGDIQNVKNIRFASKRAKCDMIDYMRDETGYRRKFRLHITSLEARLDGDEFNNTEFNLTEVIHDTRSTPGYERIDQKDLFEKLCKGLSRQETLIIKLVYIEGLNQRETSIASGLTQSHISLKLKNLLPRIRVILENLGYECRNTETKEKRAEYQKKSSLEYQRNYYEKNKKRINAQIARRRHACD